MSTELTNTTTAILNYGRSQLTGQPLRDQRIPGRAVIIGDSRVANGYGTSTNNAAYYNQRGPMNWFFALTNSPLELIHFNNNHPTNPPEGHAVGTGGETTNDMIGRYKRDVLDKKPTLVIIVAGTNDLTADQTAGTIQHNLKWMIEQANKIDAFVWVFNIDPRNNDDGNGLTAAREQVRQDVNTWLNEYVNTNGKCELIDAASILQDANGDLDSAYSYDGLHWNSAGAYRLATLALIPAWRKFVGIETRTQYSVPASYAASTNDYGNMLTNPELSGTGGITSTGVSGTIADDWRAERSTGTDITAVASIVSETDWNNDTTNFQQFVVTSTGGASDGELLRFRPTATYVTSGHTAGNWYEGLVEVKIPTGWESGLLRSIYLEVRDEDGATDTFVRHFQDAYTDGGTGNKDIWPTDTQHMVLRTPPVQVDGIIGFTYYVYTEIDATVAGTATLKFGNMQLKPVPNFQSTDYPVRLRLENDGQIPKTIRLVGTTLTVGNAED